MNFNQVLMFSHADWQTSKGKCKMRLIDLYTPSGNPEIHWYSEKNDTFISNDFGYGIKPILKSISFLNRDFLLHLAKNFSGFPIDEFTEFHNSSETQIKFSIQQTTYHFEVLKNFEIYFQKIDKKGNWQEFPFCNSIGVFNYLIQNGFDVFGWINKGLAVSFN